MSRYLILTLLLAACATPPSSTVDAFPGVLWICGGGTLAPELIAGFVADAGGDAARLVVVPGASAAADDADAEERETARWIARGIGHVVVLHTRDRMRADDPAFVAPLREATAVWFGGGDQHRLAAAYSGTRVEQEILALLERGGVVGGTSAGAAIQTRVMIAGGNPEPEMGTGLDLLQDAIVDQHFRARGREPRLVRAVQQHPECVGFGIDEGTALVVRGDAARVIGAGGVTVVRAVRGSAPSREFLAAGNEVCASLKGRRRDRADRRARG